MVVWFSPSRRSPGASDGLSQCKGELCGENRRNKLLIQHKFAQSAANSEITTSKRTVESISNAGAPPAVLY
jgi:hypothetical protein